MTTEQAEALSSSFDQVKQSEVWKKATSKTGGSWLSSPDSLRRELRSRGIEIDDPRVLLIGLDAYLAAGGSVHEDLFSDERTLVDEGIVNQMATERLEAEAEVYRAAGWSFVERSVLPGEYGAYSLDLEEFMTEDERTAANGDNWKAREKASEAARQRAEADPAARAKSGVLLLIDREGKIEARTLLVRDDEGAAQEAARREARHERLAEEAHKLHTTDAPEAPRINYALREALSEQMTLALSKAIAETPTVVLPALYACLSGELGAFPNPSPFRLSANNRWLALDTNLGERSDGSWAEVFTLAANQTRDRLIDALAPFVALLVDARVQRLDYRGDMAVRMPPLVEALILELPTFAVHVLNAFDVDAYFERVTSAQCSAALLEIDGRMPAPKKKGELAAQAVERAKATGWLPAELRTSAYVGPGAPVREAAQ
jgi:ParB family chromosome partitioning protein